jgi:hypothetical protein
LSEFPFLAPFSPVYEDDYRWSIKSDANDSYDERVLPSIGNEVLKATVAQFDGMLPPPRYADQDV